MASGSPESSGLESRNTWLPYFQCSADFPGQQVRDFRVSGDRFAAAGFRIPVNRMGTALAFGWATVGFKVVDQFLALHARTRGEILATLLR